MVFNLNGEILRSIRRSGLRRDVLKYLANIYPNKAYLSQISHSLNSSTQVISGVMHGGCHNYTAESSLNFLNLVLMFTKAGKKYYQLNRPFADEVLTLINEKRRVEVEI